MEWSRGQFVVSKQGRDNGTCYVVLKIEDQFCYVADGRKTSYLKPKKKNVKHLQATHWISPEIEDTLRQGKAPSDMEIRAFLNKHRS